MIEHFRSADLATTREIRVYNEQQYVRTRSKGCEAKSEILTVEAVSTPIAVADTCAMSILEEVQSIDLVFAGIATAEQASGLVTDGLRDELEVFSSAVSDINTACGENACSSTRMKGAQGSRNYARTVPVAGDVLGFAAHNARVWVGITVRKFKDDCEYHVPPSRKRGKKSTYWQTFDVPAQTLFQVSGSTRAWQSDSVASEVVPQWMPTAAKADGRILAASTVKAVKEEKEKYIVKGMRIVRGEVG